MRQRICSQILQHNVEQADGSKADNQDNQRRITSVRKNLVDHHLKKERRYERKQLDKKRCQKHMTECLSVSEQ
ncbi:hypothetical protein D3C87_1894350 [compost metagenome]